jgi:signal transduction histidine kinase
MLQLKTSIKINTIYKLLICILTAATLYFCYFAYDLGRDYKLSPIPRAKFTESGELISLPYFKIRDRKNSLKEYSYSMLLDGEFASLLQKQTLKSSGAPEFGLLYPQIINGGDFYLNDVWVAGLSRSTDTQRWLWYQPLLIPLPINLLKSNGEPDVIKVVQTTHEPYVLIGRPYFGVLSDLNIIYEVFMLMSRGLANTSNLFCLIAGLFMLGAWAASPKDKVFALAGCVTVLWALLFTLALWKYMPITMHKTWRLTLFLCTGTVMALMTVFTLHFINQPLSNFNKKLLFFFAGLAPIVYAIGGSPTEPFLNTLWTGPLLLIYLYACLRLAVYCIKTKSKIAIVLLFQSILSFLLAFHDYGVLTGFFFNTFPSSLQWSWFKILVEPIFLTHLSIPLMLIIMGYIFLLQYQSHVEKLAHANKNLKSKLMEREAELTISHEQQKSLELIEAKRNERDRIYQDVHDGIGSRLVTAVFSIRKGRIDIKSIEAQLMDCLSDLRMVINSQNDENSDIKNAILNYCLLQEVRLGGCGLNLLCDVGDGPAVHLAPKVSINVLRILQEALTNIIKHADASEIMVKMNQTENEMVLTISDDGQGFVAKNIENKNSTFGPSGGFGLTGMAVRAQSIGGVFCLDKSEFGTSVILRIPLNTHQ